MQFNLEVHLNIEETGMFAAGKFTAKNKTDRPRVAYQYIESIKRETGYRATWIEKVIVNGTEDITEDVREIENRHHHQLDIFKFQTK